MFAKNIKRNEAEYMYLLDGFSVNINENYFDPNMRHPVNNEQVERRNHYYKNLIQRVKKSGIRVEFITPSKYEENA